MCCFNDDNDMNFLDSDGNDYDNDNINNALIIMTMLDFKSYQFLVVSPFFVGS